MAGFTFTVAILIHAVALATFTFTDPFFEIHALKSGLHPSQVGSILSTAVAAIVIGLPIWSSLTEKYGKLLVLSVSLVLFIIATICFGLGNSLWAWRIARMLQGVAVSGISVTSTRIVLSHSEHLEQNFGYMETVTGAFASMASAAGGISYDIFGFRTSMLLVSCLSLSLFILLLISKYSELHKEVINRVISTDVLQYSNSGSEADTVKTLKLHDIMNSTVIIGALSLFQAGFANCAVDPLLNVHLYLTSNASTAMTGIVIMTYGLIYLFTAATIGYIPLPNKRLVQFGLIISFLSLSFLGPAPFYQLYFLSSQSILTITFLCMVFLGIGQAIIATTVIGLMKQSVTVKPGEDCDSAISNMFLCAWYTGEMVGYFSGGLLVQYAPNVPEVGCVEGTKGGLSCESGWAWAMTYLGLFTLCVFFLDTFFVASAKNKNNKNKKQNCIRLPTTTTTVENRSSPHNPYQYNHNYNSISTTPITPSRSSNNNRNSNSSNPILDDAEDNTSPKPSFTRLASLSTVHVGGMLIEHKRSLLHAVAEENRRTAFSLNDTLTNRSPFIMIPSATDIPSQVQREDNSVYPLGFSF